MYRKATGINDVEDLGCQLAFFIVQNSYKSTQLCKCSLKKSHTLFHRRASCYAKMCAFLFVFILNKLKLLNKINVFHDILFKGKLLIHNSCLGTYSKFSLSF